MKQTNPRKTHQKKKEDESIKKNRNEKGEIQKHRNTKDHTKITINNYMPIKRRVWKNWTNFHKV